MKRDKLLAEWFWIDRWMGSSAFLLPQEARGVYREMLTQAWRRGARLPNDHEAIRRATGTTASEWRRAWPKLERYWRVDGDSLVNDTQVEVYADAVAAQVKASERGRKGAQALAQARAQAEPEHVPKRLLKEDAKHTLKHQPPSPSPGTDNGPVRQGAPANPFMDGKHDEYVSESMRLVREISALTGEDGAEIFAKAADYEGAMRQKVNPANLTDDRLLNTVIDLRATLRDEQAKKAKRA